MQCGCPQCGTLLGKAERGLNSTCRCSRCGFVCDICVGKKTDAHPKMHKHMTREEWDELARARGLQP
ncbi:MAG: hypothetical protein PHO66_03610 [Eubacteriales bacterium]|nr:hypothetical protein [Eubacteriales bacterium]